MGLCGCFPACACGVNVCDPENGLLTITGDGDPATGGWMFCVNETPFAMANEDGGIEITPGGPYGHSPHTNLVVADSPTIALSVIPGTGLQANLLLAPGEGGGVPTGTPLMWLTNVAPSGYLLLTGPNAAGYVPIATYPALFAVIGHGFSGGVDPSDGTFLVEMPGDSFVRAQGTESLFDVGGEDTHELDITEIPQHNHSAGSLAVGTGLAGAGNITSSPAGAHNHQAGTASDALFVTVEDIAGQANREIAEATVAPGDTFSIPTNLGTGASDFEQGTRQFTSGHPAHQHTIAVADILTAVTLASGAVSGVTGNAGGSAGVTVPHENRPPFFVSNFIIKT